MKMPLGLNHQELNNLDKASLIKLLLEQGRQLLEQQVIVQELGEQLAQQQVLIQELRDQLAKDSHNSGKPPSSDGLKKPKTKSQRLKGQHPKGGQPGHKGGTLNMVESPDHIASHSVDICPHCQTDLRMVEAAGYERRQVFDIPPVWIEVTEHQVVVKQCPCCNTEVKGDFPEGVTQPTQYGPQILTQASYFNNYHFIPLARTEEALTDLYGQSPSQSVIMAANQRLVAATQGSLARIREQLVTARVANFDESGLRVSGKLHWLHVASTPYLTHYHVHEKRGQKGMAAGGILPTFQGHAVHDHWAAYLTFVQSQHTFCNAHHLRELEFIHEQYHQSWSVEMAQLLRDIHQEVKATPAPAKSLPADRLLHYSAAYDQIVVDGLAANPPSADPPPKKRGRPKQSPPKNLLDRLQIHKTGVLAFMADFDIPFDNNLAEQDIRMMKVKQKVSGTFRTREGAETFVAIRSYISTARKQGLNAISAINTAFIGQPFIPSAQTA